MEREIKFRAWDNKNKKWLLGYEYPNLRGFSLTGECVMLGEWASVFEMFLFEKNGLKWDDLKIMQYTGLKDKNEKETYEGDIVKTGYGVGSVIFVNSCFMIQWLDDKESYVELLISRKFPHVRKDDDMFEVIGNIYENNELLK